MFLSNEWRLWEESPYYEYISIDGGAISVRMGKVCR
jgi:hypothetical protein